MGTSVTLREHAARMNSVLHLTSKAMAAPQAVTVLSYASMRLRYPGNAPAHPAELAACITLLKKYPWMREPAFTFLTAERAGAWPLLIAEWDALEALVLREIGIPAKFDPSVYAPKTFRLIREIVDCQCGKAYCGHHVKQHARTETGKPGRCAVEGCRCGYFLKGDR